MATGVSSTGGTWWGTGSGNTYGQPPTPQYGTVPYKAVDPAREPAAPNFTGGSVTIDDLISQMKFLMGLGGSGSTSNALNYALYTPQELAQRGLALNGATSGALGSQAGYIGRQGANNTLQNQLAGQDIGAQRNANNLSAAQQHHTAEGQFAANGAISSDASRQALGGSDSAWKDYSRTPWNPDARGDIYRNRDLTNEGLYRQLLGTQGNYDTSQAGLYNQLAQLSPQYMQLDQSNDAYNRLLGGQVNTNVSPEMRALFAALSQAT